MTRAERRALRYGHTLRTATRTLAAAAGGGETMNDVNELCLYLGILLGKLLRPASMANFVQVLRSDEDGQERVWQYTQKLRDQLTELLREAGRE